MRDSDKSKSFVLTVNPGHFVKLHEIQYLVFLGSWAIPGLSKSVFLRWVISGSFPATD